MNIEKQYLDLLKDILENGVNSKDRTGIGTISVFGRQLKCNLNDGFPMLTTKKIHFKSVAYELLWFLRGDTNIKYLNDNGVKIWNEWADEKGDLGRIYSAQWRNWTIFEEDGTGYASTVERGIDQIKNVLEQIKINPNSRRLLVSAWNPAELDQMKLPPCHYSFQFYVRNNKLSCMFNMRSCDIVLGLPFNIASYALLTHMIANICGLGVGDLIASLGDTHIYSSHINQVNLQIIREPKKLPILKIRNNTYSDPAEFTYEDFEVIGYDSHPAIKAPIAV